MNKVYRVIWNASLGTWVAVSEIAKGKTKNSVSIGQTVLVDNSYTAQLDKEFSYKKLLLAIFTVFTANFAHAGYYAGNNGGCGGATELADTVAIGSAGGNGAGTSGSPATGGGNIVGNAACVYSQAAMAIGNNARAYSYSSIAIGSGAQAGQLSQANGTSHGADGNGLNGSSAMAIGNDAKAIGIGTTAIGRLAQTNADRTTVIGNQSYIKNSGSTNSIIIGNNTEIGDITTAVANATAIGQGGKILATGGTTVGQGAEVSIAGSVAIGQGAKTTAIGGAGFLTGSTAPASVVSVGGGTTTATRRIQNLADGANAQDAVTVAQLDKAYDDTNGRLASVLGGNATYDSSTNIYTAPTNIGGTNKNTIDEAISSVKGAAETPMTFVGNARNSGDTKDVERKLGESLTISGAATTAGTYSGANVKTVTDQTGSIAIQIADAPNFAGTVTSTGQQVNGNSVVTGTSTIGSGANAVTLSGTANGLDVGGKKITNVAAPTLGSDATNKTYVDGKVQTLADTPLGFVGDSGTKATRKLGEDLNVKGGATGTLTNGNIGVVSNGSNQLDIKLAETVNLGTNGSVTTGNTKIDNSGLTITGGPSVTSTGINAGSKVITNVAAGSAATDAVNKGQLDSSLANANSNAAVVYTNAAGDKVTKAADGKWYAATNVNADGSLIGSPSEVAAANIITSVQNASGSTTTATKLGNVAAGSVTASSTDAVNGSQLYAVSEVANKGWTVATDSGTAEASNVKPGDTVNMKGDGSVVVSNTGNDVTVGLADVVTVGQGDTAVTIDGTAGTIGGLTNTTWDPTNIVSGQAATEDQLKAVADNVTTAVGAAKTEVEAGKNVTVSSQLGDKGQTIYTVATKDEVDFNKVTVGGLTINNGGIDMGDTKITNLTAGDVNSTSTDAVNGSQLYAVSEVANKGHNVTTAATGTGTVTGTAVTNVAPGDTVTYTAGNNIEVTQNGKEIQIATSLTPTFTTVNTTNLTVTGETKLEGDTYLSGDAYYTGPITNGDNIVNKTYVDNSVTTLASNPLTFAGDTGTDVARKLGETLNIVGGNTTGTLTDGNIGIDGNGTDTLTVKLASDLTGLNSVSITNGPTINNGGIDMGDTKITNLTAGDVNSTSTDAVNGSQLYAVSEVANKGHNVTTAATGTGTVTGTAVTNVAPGDTVTYTAGNNIEVTQNGKEIQIATSLTPTFTTVNTTNLTVTGETKLEGDTYLSGDAYYTGPITNGDNIVNKTYVDNSVTTLASNPLTFAGDTGTDVARKLGETLNIVGGNTTGTLTDGNIGIDGNGTDTLTVKLASDLTGLNSVSITNGPTINNGGIDMGDTKITNVAAGDVSSTSTDAVNGSQLYAVSEVANKGHNVTTAATGTGTVTGTAVTNVAPGDTVTYTAGNNIEVTQNGKEIQIATSLTPTFTTVNTTNLTVTGETKLEGDTYLSGDAYYTGPITNGDNIVNKTYVDNSVTTLADTPLTFAGDTGANVERKLGETVNVVGGNKGALTDGNIGVVADGSDTLTVKLASDLAGLNSVSIVGGPTINGSGIDMGGDKITNVAAGDVSTTSKDAINGSQIYNLGNNVTNLFGGNASYDGDHITWNNIGGTGKNNIDDAIKSIGDQAATANKGWNLATDQGTASNVKPNDLVNINGDKASGIVVSNTGNNVTIGLSDKVKVGDKVSIDGTTGEINAGQIKIDGNKGTINNLNNTTWNGPNNIVSGQAATEDQLAQVVNNVNNQTTAAKTEVTQGDNIVVTASKAADGHSIYNVSTAKDVKFDSVTSNVVQVGNVKIDKDGINAGGQKVTNVAAGKVSTTSTDAVNGSQLYGYAEGVKNIIGGTTTYNPETGKYTNSDIGGTGKDNINDAIGAVNNSVINLGDRIDNAFYQTYKRIDKVEKEANAGIASAMAMETAPFIAGKWTYAVGAAYHGGEQAVGATLRKTADNGRWSLTGGVATGTEGDPSVRIGISGVID